MPGALILINGFPGVGKHTVARELSDLIPECKFFDTRNLIRAASQLYDADDPAHGYLRKNLKHAIFDSIAQQFAKPSPTSPPPPTYVLTDFLSVAARQTDREIMNEFIAFAQRSGFAFIHIIISCSTDENVRRLLSPQRQADAAGFVGRSSTSIPSPGEAGWYGMDEGALLQLRMEEEIGHIAPLPGLCGEYEVDTTNMDATLAAGILAEYCLDTLRKEGWWIQLNNARVSRQIAPTPVASDSPTQVAQGTPQTPAIAVTPAESSHSSLSAGQQTPPPTEPQPRQGKPSLAAATSKLASLGLGLKKKSFSRS